MYIYKESNNNDKKLGFQQNWAIPNLISAVKYEICCSNGKIYHFSNNIELFLSIPMSFIMSTTVEHSSEKIPRELMQRFTDLTHL